MSKRDRPWWGLGVVLLCVVVAAALAGCDFAAAEPTAPPSAPTATAAPAQPATPVTSDTPAAPSAITLTLWTTEAFSPTAAITRGLILAEQAALFETAHPDVRLDFVLKKPSGKGGILDFLLTTSPVVPELLPDLVLIDVDQLNTAVQAGLVQPLDNLLPGELQADLYPFARQANTLDERLYGLQVWADLDHLVYNTGEMTIPPRSWPGVLSNPGPYIFPAGGQSGLVNDAFLVQYLAARAEPVGSGPFLTQDALIAVLQFYQDGLSRGIFPPSILNYHTTADCWQDYLAGQAALTLVSAQRFQAERSGLQGAAPAAIPASNGPGGSIARGWSLALIAVDPARQALAVELMAQLSAPEVSAGWTRAAGYLPTRQAALALWDQTDSYTRFIGQQLESARPRPILANYAQVAAALQNAVEAVLDGSASPEEAAANALESVP